MEFELESNLFSINNLKTMEVIDVNSGCRLGNIKDFVIDCDEYRVLSVIIPTQKVSWFSKDNIIEIPWDRVKKIGVDVILVDGEGISDTEEE